MENPRHRRTSTFALPVVLLALIGATLAADAEGATAAEQRRELNRATASLRTAGRMLSSGRNEEAAKAFETAQTQLQSLAAGLDPKLRRSFERALTSLAETHAKLTRAGAKVTPLATITITEASGAPDLGPRGGTAPATGQISFTESVAPLLVSKCGGCHVDRAQGGFSMSSYSALMRGTRSGKVIEVGSGAESLLVDVIASGSMPPNGTTVSPEETQVLLRWINQGAKFDGDDPDKSLRDLRRGSAPASPAPAAEKPVTIPKPTGKETVSFALDIAPLLTADCANCHGGNNPDAMLSLGNFEQLWKGGNSGRLVVPGKPAESLLVAKLKGTAAEGGRMPLNRPAWTDDKIALVERWITEGASFDGPSPADPLARATAVVKASRSTSDELNQIRLSDSQRRWRLALPDEPAEQFETDRFLLIGNIPQQQLAELGSLVEAEADRVLKLFSQEKEPLDKSRLTLFIFRNRIDYSEFGTMVERRDLGGSETCNAMFDLVHPYGALVVTPDAEPPGRAIAQVVGELYIAGQSKGGLPSWLSDGTGRAVAAKLWPKDKVVDGWKQRVPTTVASLSSPEAFMTGKSPPATTQIASFGFAEALLQRPGNLLRWAKLVGEGQSVDQAARSVFKRSPEELAKLWTASVSGRR